METITEPATEPGPTGEAAPSIASRTRGALPFVLPIVGLVLGIKLLIYTYGVVVAQTISDRQFGSFWERLSFWNVWDAPNYISIATSGYQTTGEAANYIVFLPGYPYAIRFLNAIFPGDMLTAAFVVSGVASVAAAVCLGYLVRHDTDGDEDQAHRAVWFFLIFPTAYFLHLPYTESLFLALLLGSFLAARTGHWATAGILGALAAVTRLNGVFLVPALAVEAYLQYRRTGRIERSWLWIGVIGTGTLVYLGINQAVFGDPTHFQGVQDKVWFKHFQDPISSIGSMIGQLEGQEPARRQMLEQELLFLAIGLVASVAAFIWTRPSYGVWCLLNVFLFASTSWIQSTPRYVITLFPIFLLLAAVKRPHVRMVVSAGSILMLAWFTAMFATGRFAF